MIFTTAPLPVVVMAPVPNWKTRVVELFETNNPGERVKFARFNVPLFNVNVLVDAKVNAPASVYVYCSEKPTELKFTEH